MMLILLLMIAGTDPMQLVGDAAAGKQLYRQGLLADGTAISGALQGDIPFQNKRFACAGCHRVSGFGATEGANYTPPLSAETLFRERPLHRGDLFRKLFQEIQPAWFMARVSALNVRPAYSDETLAIAIREGFDVSGRPMDQVMPRFDLGPTDMANLTAYLKTMQTDTVAGIDETTIHFATVIAGPVDPDRRAAMLEVLEAYVKRKNIDTTHHLQRPGFSYMYKDDLAESWRLWQVHVWELTGAPETWTAQLAAYYRQQPVFALISGISDGSWQPVHQFCETQGVPGLFPNTDLPVAEVEDLYPVYLSQGLALEGHVLASWLDDDHGGSVLQVYRDTEQGRMLSRALGGALNLRTQVLEDGATDAWWQTLLDREQPDSLVLWLEQADLEQANRILAQSAVPQIYLSATLTPNPEMLAVELHHRLRLVWPYSLPDHPHPRAYRVRSWLRSRGIPKHHERIQFNTFFAMTMVDHALVHQVTRFSREYLIESIEHEAENGLNPGVYPYLGLGPGQRFAAGGAVIASLTDRGIRAISDRIIPNCCAGREKRTE